MAKSILPCTNTKATTDMTPLTKMNSASETPAIAKGVHHRGVGDWICCGGVASGSAGSGTIAAGE
jgi:hypothetical protein